MVWLTAQILSLHSLSVDRCTHLCDTSTYDFENLTITQGRSSWFFLDDHHPHCPGGHHTGAQPVLELHVSWIVDDALFCMKHFPLMMPLRDPCVAACVGSLFFFTADRWPPWWLRRWSIWWQCRRPRFNPWVGKTPWRREWPATPVFLPAEFHGQRSRAGSSPRGRRESDVTGKLTHMHTHSISVEGKWQSLSRVWLLETLWTVHGPWSSPGQNTGVGSKPFSSISSGPRSRTGVSCTAGGFLINCAIREAPISV